MSDVPKWMPDDAALLSMEYHAEEALRLGSHRNTHDAMRAFAYRTGLRAQIAVLEEFYEAGGDWRTIPERMCERMDALRKELGK